MATRKEYRCHNCNMAFGHGQGLRRHLEKDVCKDLDLHEGCRMAYVRQGQRYEADIAKLIAENNANQLQIRTLKIELLLMRATITGMLTNPQQP